MDNESTAGRTLWLQKRIVPALAVLALVLLTFWVWKQRIILSTPALTPTPAVPTEAKRWVQLSSPFDGKINALLVEYPNGMRMLYAAADGGIFKSADQGKTWTACNNGLNERLIRSLAIDPHDPRMLYAGTWNGKVYISMDGGANWEQRSPHSESTDQPPPYEIRSLYVHTFNSQKLYAATYTDVFTSPNRGLNWYPAGSFTGTLQCMVIHPEQPDILYVGTSAYGIYKSLDGATTWFPLPYDPDDVSALVVPPRAPNTAYAISKGKVYKTEEGGNFWRYVDSYREHIMARCLAVNPRNPQEIYVGVQDGLHKSIDGRKSWFKSDAGLRGPEGQPVDVQIVVVDPITTSTVYACSGNMFFVSNDAGQTWTWTSNITASNEANVLALKADPKERRTFYASIAGGGLYKTTNGGDEWQHIGEIDPFAPIRSFSQITAIEVDPLDTRIVYIGVAEGFVLKSMNSGLNWIPTGMVTEALISTLVADPEQTMRLYAGTQGKGVFRSNDGGISWTHKSQGLTDNHIQRIVLDPRGPQTIAYAVTERGVFISHDNGESWQMYLLGASDITTPTKGSIRLFALTQFGISETQGEDREGVILLPQNRVIPGAELKQLTMSQAMPHLIYVLANHKGVLLSEDGGVSWTSLGSGLEGRELHALALSPDDTNLILVGTDKGIYRYQP